MSNAIQYYLSKCIVCINKINHPDSYGDHPNPITRADFSS